jgi:hypothetical protein
LEQKNALVPQQVSRGLRIEPPGLTQVQLTNIHLEKSQGVIQKKKGNIAARSLVVSQPSRNIDALTGKVVQRSTFIRSVYCPYPV